MKRYGNLYDKICDINNLILADEKARKGKKNTFGVRVHDKNRDDNLKKLQKQLIDGTFKTSEYKTMLIYEPKERLIYKLHYYPDRIVHHAIMNILEPIWINSMTTDTYANIKRRGIHSCANKLKHLLYIDNIGTKYCLKVDIRKYYPSINHEALKNEIRRKIKDLRLLKLIDEIIDSEEGLPIGNYLSQYLANVFLSRLDHRLKEIHKVRYYFRYVDDMVFLSDSKQELKRILSILIIELKDLKLELKQNWQIFPVDSRGINFLGYVFFHKYTLLRKRIKKKIFKRIGQYRRCEIRYETFNHSMSSWNGWMIWCDSNRLVNNINNILSNIEKYKNMKSQRDERPEPIESIGNGKYYVNMDIREIENQNIVNNENDEIRISYECDTVKINGYPTYPSVVEALIREKYTTSDELAIQRQKDSKPEQFDEYNQFCEDCKSKARPIFYPEGGE